MYKFKDDICDMNSDVDVYCPHTTHRCNDLVSCAYCEYQEDLLIVTKTELREQGFKKWFFTFGCGQKNAGYCQPIYAKTYNDARQGMVDRYGIEWSFQYDEEQWEETRNKPWVREVEMDPMICDPEVK